MGMSPVMNPYGGPLILCDKMLGNAYEVVKFVARHINIICQVSANMEALVALANGSPQAPVPASGDTLTIPNVVYVPDTSTQAVTLNLALLSSFGEGQSISVFDAMGNAANYPITVVAGAGDDIDDHGVSASQHVINHSYALTRYFKRNGLWRTLQYGG